MVSTVSSAACDSAEARGQKRSIFGSVQIYNQFQVSDCLFCIQTIRTVTKQKKTLLNQDSLLGLNECIQHSV
jgi:hypothetical protein